MALALLSRAVSAGLNADGDPVVAQETPPVMRAPFTLKLHVDRDHYYKEDIGEMPYVYGSSIYLVSGDNFGVTLAIRDGKLAALAYQPDLTKADVAFEFTQIVERDGSCMMKLTIHNRTASTLKMRALMTVPGAMRAVKTSILPVEPGLTSFESWPHPIVKLLLHDVQVGA